MSRVRWGDVDADDEDQRTTTTAAATTTTATATPQQQPLGIVSEVIDKSTGVKTIVEYATNVEGQRVKIVRRIKTTMKPITMNKNVIIRRKWRKFGEARYAGDGPELNVTIPSNENLQLDLRPKKREEIEGQSKEDSAFDKIKGATSIVVCSYCKEPGHFSLKCPKRSQLAPKTVSADGSMVTGDSKGGAAAAAGASAGGIPIGGKYVPMHMRGAGGAGDRDMRSEEPTLRVTNLSEDVTEADLHELFRRFGHTSRIYLAKDRITNQSRGFAFVNFTNRTDAQLAIDKLNGHGYDNLILHVEWAKAKV